jgi:hypothetical protein
MKIARRTLSEKGKRDVARVHDSFQCSERHCGRVEKGQPSADGWQRAWGYYYSRTLFKIYFYQGICKKGGRTFIFAKIKPTL